MDNVLVGASFAAFVLFYLYHTTIDVELRLSTGAENTASASAAFLGGAVRVAAEAQLRRNQAGKLEALFSWNGKPAHAGKPKRKKRQKEKGDKGFKELFALSEPARLLLIRYVDLRSLGASMTIGIASDAATTAKVCGLALTVLECAAGVLRALKPKARILMRSAPNFKEDCLRIRFTCIFGIKTGHIILIAGCFCLQILKGAFAKWRIRLRASCVPPWKTSKT